MVLVAASLVAQAVVWALAAAMAVPTNTAALIVALVLVRVLVQAVLGALVGALWCEALQVVDAPALVALLVLVASAAATTTTTAAAAVLSVAVLVGTQAQISALAVAQKALGSSTAMLMAAWPATTASLVDLVVGDQRELWMARAAGLARGPVASPTLMVRRVYQAALLVVRLGLMRIQRDLIPMVWPWDQKGWARAVSRVSPALARPAAAAALVAVPAACALLVALVVPVALVVLRQTFQRCCLHPSLWVAAQ